MKAFENINAYFELNTLHYGQPKKCVHKRCRTIKSVRSEDDFNSFMLDGLFVSSIFNLIRIFFFFFLLFESPSVAQRSVSSKQNKTKQNKTKQQQQRQQSKTLSPPPSKLSIDLTISFTLIQNNNKNLFKVFKIAKIEYKFTVHCNVLVNCTCTQL